MTVVESIEEEIHFQHIVDDIVPKRNQGMSVGKYLYLIVLNMVIEPKSKASLGKWLKNTAITEYREVDFALLYLALLKKRLEESETDISLDRAMETLRGIRLAHCYYPQKSKPVQKICRMGSTERELLTSLNIQFSGVR